MACAHIVAGTTISDIPLPDTSFPSAPPKRVPVLIAGGGPVGLTLAALLARYGVRSMVIEADETYCTGSRAICVSRRSQEILGWVGADEPIVRTGLSWTGGRSYFRNEEILHFEMPSDATQRFAPMVNIQQFYIEEFAHRAILRQPAGADICWASKVTGVRPQVGHVEVDVQSARNAWTVQADWVVACDGGRSAVRELMGLQLEGIQYEGRYVIVDIRQKTARQVERLAWFDPPSNPGSTILMHRQPDDVWRIDYQIRDDEDPDEAIRPDRVLPRVRDHLAMIGETEPWQHLWISIYNAKCLTLPKYRFERVLFAGDAAHLVPIFGVRGLNSGLDDAGNLAWKLALVLEGRASDSLLDSYSYERVLAARENIAYGSKSTEFMAPPHYGFRLMRDAALRLATEEVAVRALVNPRQSTPVEYINSPLSVASRSTLNEALRVGMPAPEVMVSSAKGQIHLSQLFGASFVILCFNELGVLPVEMDCLAQSDLTAPAGVDVICIACTGAPRRNVYLDESGQFAERYGAVEGSTFLVRPDGYLMGCWRPGNAGEVAAALAPYGVLTSRNLAGA